MEKLRQREHELAVFVSGHRFWTEVTTAERVDKRMKLKHAHEVPPGGNKADNGEQKP